VGNNAIGTSLRLGLPARFALAEHYCDGWTDWTCAAVPVRCPLTRGVLGTLDVSGYRRPPSSAALALALRLARVIGEEWGLAMRGAPARPLERWAGQVPRSGCPLLIAHRDGGRFVFRPEDVDLLRAHGPEVFLLASGGTFRLEGAGLGRWEERLRPHGFFRADRSHLVNLRRVAEVQPGSGRTLCLILAGPERIRVPVARRRVPALRAILGF
jgi:hypothetical protein